jgi:hypothetical protein
VGHTGTKELAMPSVLAREYCDLYWLHAELSRPGMCARFYFPCGEEGEIQR